MRELKNRNIPPIVNEYIRGVIRAMRYRRKVQADVRQELTDHFADALKDCENDQQRVERAKQLIEEFGDVKLLGKLLRRAKKRCRPLWRTVVVRIFQIIGILILWQIFYTTWLCFIPPRIQVDYVQETTNLTRAAQDESMNAAVLYQQAINDYQEPPKVTGKERVTEFMMAAPAINGNQAESGHMEDEVSLLDILKDTKTMQELDPRYHAALEQWIGDNEKAITLLREASRRPMCWWERRSESGDLITILLPEVYPVKNLFTLLYWQAQIYAIRGDYSAAFENLLTCYRMGIHLKGLRTLIEQYTGFGIQTKSCQMIRLILDRYPVPGAVIAEVQKNLSTLRKNDQFTADFQCEELFYKDFLQRFYSDNGRGSGRILPMQILRKGGAYDLWLPNYMTDDFVDRSYHFAIAVGSSWVTAGRGEMESEFERIYQTVQAYASKTPWEIHHEHVDLGFDLLNYSPFHQIRYWPVYMLTPSLGRVILYASINQAETEATITTFAIESYHQEQGAYPDSLSELVDRDYLETIPDDPFSNTSLIYRKAEEGFILYSMGENFTDDGGQVYRKHGEVQLWNRQKGDAVFWPVPGEQSKD